MALISKDTNAAKQLLDKGEVIGLPTETVYGLAGNATNESAVLKIFEVKNRPKFDPLILHFSNFDKAKGYIEEPSEKLLSLVDRFSPGPATFLVPKKKTVSDLITAGLPRVAIRIPSHPTAQALLKSVDYPVAAPSANPFGYVSPTSAQHVEDQLGNKIPFILDGGNCAIGLESTIIGEEEGNIIIYRKGGLEIEAIEAIVGSVIQKERSSSQPAAPGMLHSHYAPKVKTKLLPENSIEILSLNPENALLLFKKPIKKTASNNIFFLSEKGDMKEAALNLFKRLRELDRQNFSSIFVELAPEAGLGRAINDRLRRATNS